MSLVGLGNVDAEGFGLRRLSCGCHSADGMPWFLHLSGRALPTQGDGEKRVTGGGLLSPQVQWLLLSRRSALSRSRPQGSTAPGPGGCGVGGPRQAEATADNRPLTGEWRTLTGTVSEDPQVGWRGRPCTQCGGREAGGSSAARAPLGVWGVRPRTRPRAPGPQGRRERRGAGRWAPGGPEGRLRRACPGPASLTPSVPRPGLAPISQPLPGLHQRGLHRVAPLRQKGLLVCGQRPGPCSLPGETPQTLRWSLNCDLGTGTPTWVRQAPLPMANRSAALHHPSGSANSHLPCPAGLSSGEEVGLAQRGTLTRRTSPPEAAGRPPAGLATG